MRLLICTQAVDRADPVLGFFHTWIETLSKKAEAVEVVCLKEGSHMLPNNVHIHSLGKERGRVSRLRYAWRFWRLVWRLRSTYDAVFVHMNEEYVLLGGVLWHLLGKRVVLWRNHKMGSMWTHVAGRLAHEVCYTSPEAYVARFNNAVEMPVGIDTKLFASSDKGMPRKDILFFGRLDPVKKPEVFLEAMKELEQELPEARADVYGDPTPGHEHYAAALKKRFAGLSTVSFMPGVPHEQSPGLYRSHAVYVNLTPAGSFDKTIGEAMAAGGVVVAANAAVQEVLGPRLFVQDANSSLGVAKALAAALALSPEERTAFAHAAEAWVVSRHSLDEVVERLVTLLSHD